MLQINYFYGMKVTSRHLFFFFVLLLPGWGRSQVSGRVTDNLGEPLIGATVQLLPDSQATATDIDGRYFFPKIATGEHTLAVTYVGFQARRRTFDYRPGEPRELNFQLSPTDVLLDAVTITEEHAKQENTLATVHLSERYLEQNIQGSFAKSLEKLPGLSTITTGLGIAKPVIRGLSFNRIIVNHNGIKQEGQQWGADHGLEIDQYGVERIEIIKGPASLQYGSDGLGGVVNIMPGKIPQPDGITGSIQGIYKTNNQHYGGSAYLGVNVDNYFLTARYSRQDYASFRVPADTFVYNGFALPIFDNTLKNTAGEEENLSLNLGFKRDWTIARLVYTHYDLEAGLFPGAIGIPRAYALNPVADNRGIGVPSQAVTHRKVSYSQTFFFGDDHLDFNLGYQHNHRREFSFPENHNRFFLEDPNDRLALELILQTWSANLHYEHHPRPGWKNVFGITAQYQDNQRGGFEFLIPDFTTLRSGLFAISEVEWREDLSITGGLRLDYGRNQTVAFEQPYFDGQGNILDYQGAVATDNDFFNFSGSIGLNYTLSPDRWFLKANLGKSFRVPYPNETSSDGVHHGNFRHELGTPDLRSEHGYQADASIDWNLPRFRGNLAGYFNFFQDFIYLNPTGRFVFRQDAGQTYQYVQNDAIYTGFELEWEYRLSQRFTLRNNVEYVYNINLDNRRPLPFTPPPSVLAEFTYQLPRIAILQALELAVSNHYFFAKTENTIAQFEEETPAYNLIDLSLSFELAAWNPNARFSIQVQNLFDLRYLNHLSRYRIINVPEQGRNVVFSVKIPFSTGWRK